LSTELPHRFIETNGIRLHVAEAGPEDGPLVILLHGFPEFWYGWRKQIPALAGAGLRVMAPDQRGYNLSDRPRGAAAYNLDELAADVIGLMEAVGRERAAVVGHDFGGAVAWWLANTHPERVERLAILNVPHHTAFRRQLRDNPNQRRKSRYMAFFQLPVLSETTMRLGGIRLFKLTSRRGAFTAEDLARYREAWAQPGAWTAMLNWYRAVFRHRPTTRPASRRITVPTLVIWGLHDPVFVRALAQQSVDMCDDGRLIRLDDAGHWVQHEEPERVNAALIAFLT
jgi:pimeloyl-ACP methyl ester carboxylesterase